MDIFVCLATTDFQRGRGVSVSHSFTFSERRMTHQSETCLFDDDDDTVVGSLRFHCFLPADMLW